MFLCYYGFSISFSLVWCGYVTLSSFARDDGGGDGGADFGGCGAYSVTRP